MKTENLSFSQDSTNATREPRFNWAKILYRILVFFPVIFFLLTPLFFSLKAEAATGINKQINFQGKLVDSSGLNVADSTYSVVFTLYDASSGGTNLWTETDSVTTTAGIFQVPLGAVNTTLGNVNFNSDTIYLGIKVGADAEMTPRIRFSSVPYALNAGSLSGVVATQSASGFTLTGGTSNLKTLGINNTVTFGTVGSTDGLTFTLPGSTATLAGLGVAQTFSAAQTFGAGLSVSGGQNLSLSSGTGTYSQTYTAASGTALGVSATSLTTGVGMQVTGGSAMTTGNDLSLSGTFVHAIGETGNLANLSFTENSSNASGTVVTNGINVAPTIQTSGAGAKIVNSINAAAPSITNCTSGGCTLNGVNINTLTAGSGATITNNGININATGVSGGSLNGINLSSITSGAGSETGITIGRGWDLGVLVQSGGLYLDRNNLSVAKEATPTAPSAADGGAGGLTGFYSYCVTFVTAQGETLCSPATSGLSVTSRQITVSSIPTGTSNVVLSRRLYRAKSFTGAAPFPIYQLVQSGACFTAIADNVTTSCTDNMSDAGVGINAPIANTTGAIGTGSSANAVGDIVSAGGLQVDARAYGVRCDGQTDDATSLQSALDSLSSTGGIVKLPPGQCRLGSTVTMDDSGVILSGAGAYANDDASAQSSTGKGTTFVWVGSAGGTMIKTTPASIATGKPALKRIGIENVSLMCVGSADIGLQVISTQYSFFRNMYFSNCAKVGMDMNTVAGSLGEATDTTRNEISNINMRLVDSSLAVTTITTAAALNSGTITVQCATNCATAFSSGANSLAVFSGEGTPQYISCTAANTTTFTGCTGGPTWSSSIGDRVAVAGPASASGFSLAGSSSSSPLGNTSENNFNNIQILYVHGTAITLNNSDSNRFYGIALNRGSSTGLGIEFQGGTSATDSSRGNDFFFMDQGPPGSTTTTTNSLALPQGTIAVASTAVFASQTFNTLRIRTTSGMQTITCTGVGAGPTLTGCAGGTGTYAIGAQVSLQPIQVVARGTATINPDSGVVNAVGAQNNNFYELTRENSTNLPSIEPGAALFYQTSTRDTSSYQIASGGETGSNFGTLNISGAFLGRNSYFGEEFNSIHANNDTADTALGRGDYGNPAVAANGTGGGELTVDVNATGVGATAAVSSAADTMNGVEQINAVSAAGGTMSVDEYSGVAVGNAQYNWSTGSLPVFSAKVRMSTAGSNTVRYFVGLTSMQATLAGNPGTDGIYFSNCSVAAGTTCDTTLRGVTQNAAGSATFVTCGTIDTTKYMYLRIEVRSPGDVHFFADMDVSNGIQETECGNGSTTTIPAAATGLTYTTKADATTAGAATTTLLVDYVRIWQDDAPSGLTIDTNVATNEVSSSGLTTEADGSSQVDQAKAAVALDNAQMAQPEDQTTFASTVDADASDSAQTASKSSLLKSSLLSDKQPTDKEASMAALLSQYDTDLVNVKALTVADDATVSGDLHIAGNSLVEGILNVVDTLTANNVVVNQLATFFGDVVFHGDVSFTGVPTFNTDTAGYATVAKGSDKTQIKFTKEYAHEPIVNASLVSTKLTNDSLNQSKAAGVCDQNDDMQTCQDKVDKAILSDSIKYVVTDRTTKGFSIQLENGAKQPMTFSWTALSVGK